MNHYVSKVFYNSVFLLGFSTLSLGSQLPKGSEWEKPQGPQSLGSEEAKAGGEINLAIAYRLNQWNPLEWAPAQPERAFLKSFFVPLWRSNKEDQWVGMLAIARSQPKDAKTFYLKLDSQARWSDRRPITTQDVIFSIKTWAKWGNPEERLFFSQVVDSRALDSYTLRLSFSRVFNQHWEKLGKLVVLPKHHFKDHIQAAKVSGIPPHSGPYVLVDPSQRDPLEFQKLDNWWGAKKPWAKGRFNPKKIRLYDFGGAEAQLLAFQKGQLEGLLLTDGNIARQKLAILQRGYAYKYDLDVVGPRPCVGLWLNSENPLLANLKLRSYLLKIFNLSVFASAVSVPASIPLKSCYDGRGDWSTAMTPAEPTVLAADGLRDEGFKLVDKLGVRVNERGERLSFTFSYLHGTSEALIRGIQAQAAQQGIELRLQPETLRSWSERMANGNQGVFYGGFQNDVEGPLDFRSYWHSESIHRGQNVARIKDTLIDQYIEAYEQEQDPELQKRRAHDIQKHLVQAQIFIPGLDQEQVSLMLMRWIKFPKENLATIGAYRLLDPFNASLGGLFWIDPEEKERSLKALGEGKSFDPLSRTDRGPH